MKLTFKIFVVLLCAVLGATAQDTTNVFLHPTDSVSEYTGTEEIIETEYAWELPVTDTFYSQSEIKWQPVQALNTQVGQNKKTLLYISANWCKWCRAMKDSVFNVPSIANDVTQYFNPVYLNGETTEKLNYRGKTYIHPPGARAHELTLQLTNNQAAYPCFIIFDANSTMLAIKKGFMDPIAFDNFLNFYATDAYIAMPFDEFVSRYPG